MLQSQQLIRTMTLFVVGSLSKIYSLYQTLSSLLGPPSYQEETRSQGETKPVEITVEGAFVNFNFVLNV